MGGVQTYYDNAGVNTVAHYPGAGAGTGTGAGMAIDPFFLDILRRREAMQQQFDNERLAEMRQGRELQSREADYADPNSERNRAIAQRAQQAQDEEAAYQRRRHEIDLNPPKKLTGMGFNMTPGYTEDTTLLPLSMRPGTSSFERGGLSLRESMEPQRLEASIQEAAERRANERAQQARDAARTETERRYQVEGGRAREQEEENRKARLAYYGRG